MRYIRVFAVLICFCSVALASTPQGSCVNDAVVGSYVYSYTGLLATNNGMATINSFRPTATAGRIVFAADGTLSGAQTDNSTGVAFRITYTGTYTFDSATGSGSLTRMYQSGFEVKEDFYATNDGREIRFIRFYPAEFIVSGTAVRQSKEPPAH